MSPAAEIAVVTSTRDRRDRLAAMLDSLAAQTLAPERFEVVVVDDGSEDATPELLAERVARGDLELRTVRHDRSLGPAHGRDAGWRAATAPLIAFTDDDCELTPGWLEALLEAARAHPGAVVMGRTDPNPAEAHLISPFTRTIRIHRAGPPYETCNILYPRELLERLDGFDTSFPKPGGEDTDLGWRATEAGAPCVYAPGAQAHHAVMQLGPIGKLHYARWWTDQVRMFKGRPGLRRAQLHRGVFISPIHEHLLRALVAVVLPRRLWPVSLALAWPYLVRLLKRRTGPLLAPYLIAYDVLELLSTLRGAIRERVPVL